MPQERQNSFPISRRFFQQPGMPLYYQLARLIRQRIEQGELPPGSRLPSLIDLAEEYGIARVTVRQAVQLLVTEGFLVSTQGRGTSVVSELPVQHHESMKTSWAAMVRRIEGASVELLETADLDFCPLFTAEEEKPAPIYHYMKRIHIKNKIRFAFIELYLDKRLFDLAPDRFNQTTVIPVMGELGIEVSEARQTMTISTASLEVAQHLLLTPGSPVALIRRIARDESGCAIYAAQMAHPGNMVRFDIDLVNEK